MTEFSSSLFIAFIIFTDIQDDSENGLTADEIKLEAQKWVFRCKIGAVLGWMLFIAWVVVAQIYRGDVFPNSMYMLSSDSAEMTGW